MRFNLISKIAFVLGVCGALILMLYWPEDDSNICRHSRNRSGLFTAAIDLKNIKPINRDNASDLRRIWSHPANGIVWTDGNTLQFSPDDRLLISSNYRGDPHNIYIGGMFVKMAVFAEESCSFRFYLEDQDQYVEFENFSSDGHWMLLSSERTYYLYDTWTLRDSSTLYPAKSFELESTTYYALIISNALPRFIRFPDAERILFGVIPSWLSLDPQFPDEPSLQFQHARGFSPDSQFFIAYDSHNDDHIEIRNSLTNQVVFGGNHFSEWALNEFTFQFSPDSKWLATRNNRQDVQVRALQTGELQIQINEPEVKYFMMRFSSDGELFGYGKGVWDLATGEQLRDLGLYSFAGFAFSDSTILARNNEKNKLVLLDVNTGGILKTIEVPSPDYISDFDVNTQENLLALAISSPQREGFHTSTIELWGVTTPSAEEK